MTSHLEKLLRASIAIADLRKQLLAKEAECSSLRRQIGMQRLAADLKADEVNLAADEVPALLRKQI